MVLGPVAGRLGAVRVLAAAVAGVPAGAALMAVPGPAALAVVGLLLLGLAMGGFHLLRDARLRGRPT